MRYSDFLKDNYNYFLDIFNKMKIGVWITDGEGRIVIVNDESAKTGGLRREELIGRKMADLIEMGYVLYESSIIKAMNSRNEESIVQEMGTGGYLLATSMPLFYDNKIDLVICVERNISEIENLKHTLDEQMSIKARFQSELLQMKNQIVEEECEFVTRNINMIHLREAAVEIGKIDATVIITGESGVGKEVIADLIHKNSKRAKAPFVKINCAAIPETLMESEFFGYEKGTFTGASVSGKMGIFELADGGTLLLDEIGELPLSLQSKLLRVIQEKEVRRIGGEKAIKVDVRIIVATNRDLKKEMEAGNFRSDLYYRLFVVPIKIPPLRERKEDISVLANHFIKKFNIQYERNKVLTRDAMNVMEAYDWPGNVRELGNVVERLVVSGAGDEISGFQVKMCLKERDYLDVNTDIDTTKMESLDIMISDYEREIIEKALEENKSVTATAKALGVDKSTISRKLKKYGL